MSDELRTKTIETPYGSITTKTTTVEPTPQVITAASLNTLKTINANASQGNKFIATYLPKVDNPTLKDFDVAFRMWQADKSKHHTKQQVIEILGAHLGNKLVSDFKMEWVVVKDEYGTDLAVRAKKYEVVAFPFSSVVKRIENNQYDFMVGVYHAVKASIESGDAKAR